MGRVFNLSFVTLLVIVFASIGLPVQLDAQQATKIEDVGLAPKGESQLRGGVRLEQDRTLATIDTENALEYSNTRINAFDYRMGVLDNVELLLGVNYSRNSANSSDTRTPNQSGIEGIELGTKLQWHPNIATSIKGKFNATEDVYPYGSDDPSFSVNLPIKFEMGDGIFHGEIGFTTKSGNALDNNGFNTFASWNSYLNYGIGYSFEVNRFTDMSLEVVGNGSPVEGVTPDGTTDGDTTEGDTTNTSGPPSPDFEDDLELVIGSRIRLARNMHLEPSFGFALMDGSPDASFGVQLEIDFGGRHFPDPEEDDKPAERFSRRSAVGGVTPAETQTDLQMKQKTREQDSQEQKDVVHQSRKEKINRLMQDGYELAQDGKVDEAIEAYEKAEQLNPRNLLVLSNMGSLYYRKGNYQQAKESYEKAVSIDPQDAFSRLYLGASYFQLGDKKAARQEFEKVLELDPDNQRARNWLNKMRS